MSWSGRPKLRNRRESLMRDRDLLRNRRDRGGWRSSELGRNSSRETDSKRFPGTRQPQTSTETEWLLVQDNNSSSRNSSSPAHSCRLRTSFLWETHSSLSSL